MYVAISPLRISFACGGTDLPEYFNNFDGYVVSSTINLFTNIIINLRRDDSFQAFSPDYELHHKVSDFENLQLMPGTDIAVAVIKYLNYKLGADYFICSDVQPGSGLGGSSSLTVNCINTIQTIRGESYDSKKIAETAFHIERNLLNHQIGKQDDFITAFGGFNLIKFSKNDVNVIPIPLSNSSCEELSNNLMLFFIGLTRKSSDVLLPLLKSIKNNDEKTMNSLHTDKDLALELYDSLKSNDISGVAEIMNKGWKAKKQFGTGVSNDKIDKIYSSGIEAGAISGKITGAGGGGHILFYCEKQKQPKLKEKMESLGLKHIQFKFYNGKPKVLNLYEQMNRY